jgi:hypothetical protein
MRAVCLALLSVLLSVLGPFGPARAQTVVEVENSATLRYENSATVNVENGTMDFRGPGTFSRLNERGAARVTNGQLTATRDVGAPSATDVAGLGAVLTAAKDLGTVTVTRGHANQNAAGGSMDRYYDISATQNNSGLDATLTLRYEDAELAGIAEDDLLFLRSTDGGASFTARGIDGQDTGADTATLNGVASFSRWTLGAAIVDLRLSAVASEPERDAGEQTSTTVTLTHAGGSLDATGVEVGVSVESGLVQQGSRPSTGSFSGSTWDVGTLSSGSAATLDLTVEQDNAQPGVVDAQVTALNEADATPARTAASIVPRPYGSGTALALDGNDDYVRTGAGGDELGLVNESFSVGVWFRLDSSGDERTLVGMDEPEKENETLVIGEENGQFLFAFFGNDLRGGSVPTGEWVHATFVYDAARPDGENDRFIYKNGTQVAADEASADFQGTDEVLLGRNREGNYFDGRIDQVRVWQGPLSKSEVRARLRRTDPAASGLLAAYRFDASGGTTAYDVRSGDGASQNGTLQNDASITAFSGAPVGQQSAVVQSGSQAVGPSGARITVENVSASGSDALVVTRHGQASGPSFDNTQPGEDFSQISDDVSKRLHVVWGLGAIGAPNADVTIGYSGVAGLSDPQNVRLLKRARGPGTAWQDVSDQWTWDEQGQTFARSDVSSFSQYAIGEASTALPVEVAALDAQRAGSAAGPDGPAVQLVWRTASETHNAGFRVERQAPAGNGRTAANWTPVGYVASEASGGTSKEPLSYRFRDDSVPFAADTARYRLVQVDTDGEKRPTEPVEVALGAVKKLTLKDPYPNPARNRTTVKLAVPKHQSGTTYLQLYNALGRQVRTLKIDDKGRQQIQLQTDGLASGVYFLRLTAGGAQVTRKVTVVR